MDLIEGIKTFEDATTFLNAGTKLWEMDLIEGIKTDVFHVSILALSWLRYEKWTW